MMLISFLEEKVKLRRLFFEDQCKDCQKRLGVDDLVNIKPGMSAYCNECGIRAKKVRKRKDDEEAILNNNGIAVDQNMFNVSRQMPDRGHDIKRGTAGWVMGDLSPGRSF